MTQDYAEAVKYYLKAAGQGFAKAQFNLGLCYAKGEGTTQNDLEAYIWLSLAAAQSISVAPHNRDIVASRMSREEIIEGSAEPLRLFLIKKLPVRVLTIQFLPKIQRPVVQGFSSRAMVI